MKMSAVPESDRPIPVSLAYGGDRPFARRSGRRGPAEPFGPPVTSSTPKQQTALRLRQPKWRNLARSIVVFSCSKIDSTPEPAGVPTGFCAPHTYDDPHD
jgi:hypothetical protein